MILGDAMESDLRKLLDADSQQVDELTERVWTAYTAPPIQLVLTEQEAAVVSQSIPACVELTPEALLFAILGHGAPDLREAQVELLAALGEAGRPADPIEERRHG